MRSPLRGKPRTGALTPRRASGAEHARTRTFIREFGIDVRSGRLASLVAPEHRSVLAEAIGLCRQGRLLDAAAAFCWLYQHGGASRLMSAAHAMGELAAERQDLRTAAAIFEMLARETGNSFFSDTGAMMIARLTETGAESRT